jgi:hypothetical protein
MAFMSYARQVDNHDRGSLTRFCELLSGEVHAQTGEDFPIFQDRVHLRWGVRWKERLMEALDDVVLFIPVLTPGFFTSDECCEELKAFLAREERVQRRDLIFPLYYIDCPVLERPERRKRNELAQQIGERERRDWRDLRFTPLDDPAARQRLASLAAEICGALELVQAAFVREGSEPPARTAASSVAGETEDMESLPATPKWASVGPPPASQVVTSQNFLSEPKIREIVTASLNIRHREHVLETLLLFKTRVQQTWIVTTSVQMFCVLDDTRKRPTGRLIQWRRPLDAIDSVRARAHRPGAGLIDIGPKRNWLYSKRLHPVAARLEEAVQAMIGRARQTAQP